jgi:hypothetical protein
MITLDTTTFFVMILGAAIVGALLGVLPAWLRLTNGADALPVWAFLRRRRVAPERHAAFHAELRCEMCDSRVQCTRLLAEGIDLPAAGCPNGALFTAASRTPAARQA